MRATAARRERPGRGEHRHRAPADDEDRRNSSVATNTEQTITRRATLARPRTLARCRAGGGGLLEVRSRVSDRLLGLRRIERRGPARRRLVRDRASAGQQAATVDESDVRFRDAPVEASVEVRRA